MNELDKELETLEYLEALITDNIIYFKIFYEIKNDSIKKTFEIIAFNSNPKIIIKKDTIKYLPEKHCYSVEYEQFK